MLEVDGRQLAIRNLDRVVFPRAGTTKSDLLDYYVHVGDVMLPHLRERQLHMHRYPEGVEGPRFWQKACPEHRPDWMPTVPVWSHDKQADIEYCVVNELAALLWAVNLGSIELHTSLHRCSDLHRPTVLAFDLDPGEGVGLAECCEVALHVRDAFAATGLRAFAKTSGSKGIQVYIPLNTETSYAVTKPLSRKLAELLEARSPGAVVSRMARTLRKEMDDVIERIAKHGDLFEPVLSLVQPLRPGERRAGHRPGSHSAAGFSFSVARIDR